MWRKICTFFYWCYFAYCLSLLFKYIEILCQLYESYVVGIPEQDTSYQDWIPANIPMLMQLRAEVFVMSVGCHEKENVSHKRHS